MERIRQFLDYLIRCEERWVVECKRRDLPEDWAKQIIRDELRPALLKDAEAALESAIRRYGVPGTGKSAPVLGSTVEASTKTVDSATYEGVIVYAKADKDYVFVRAADGSDWFSHRRDFITAADWLHRARGARCAFLRGTWNGKPRATSVRLAVPRKRKKAKR